MHHFSSQKQKDTIPVRQLFVTHFASFCYVTVAGWTIFLSLACLEDVLLPCHISAELRKAKARRFRHQMSLLHVVHRSYTTSSGRALWFARRRCLSAGQQRQHTTDRWTGLVCHASRCILQSRENSANARTTQRSNGRTAGEERVSIRLRIQKFQNVDRFFSNVLSIVTGLGVACTITVLAVRFSSSF